MATAFLGGELSKRCNNSRQHNTIMTQTGFHWLMAAQAVHTLMPFGTAEKHNVKVGRNAS